MSAVPASRTAWLCPTCGTPADESCRTRSGHEASTMHAAKERHLYGRSSHEVWADAVRARHGLVRINASRTGPASTVQTLEIPPESKPHDPPARTTRRDVTEGSPVSLCAEGDCPTKCVTGRDLRVRD